MSKVVITRPAEWTNWGQRYKLRIDREAVGDIKRDEIKEFEVAAGTHEIDASVGWMSSQPYMFDIREDETIYLKVSVSKLAGSWRQIGSIAVLLYIFVIRNVFKTEGTVWETVFYFVLVLLSLFLIYDVTLGKKNHLWIRPDIR